METKKKKRNRLHIENGWRRIFLASGLAFWIVVLGEWIFGGIHSLDIIAEYEHMTGGGQILMILCFACAAVFLEGLFATKEFTLVEVPAVGERVPERRKGNFNLVFSHGLPQEEALRRIQLLLTEVKAEHGDQIDALEEQWEGNKGTFRLSVRGYWVSGILTVEPTHVELDGNIPFPASLAKGQIEKVIREQAQLRLV